MTRHTRRSRSGVSLVEVATAIIVLTISMLGTAGYRHHAAIQSKRAQAKVNATRAAQALIDTWCGLYGDQAYRPETHLSPLLTVAPYATGPACPAGFTELGTYEVLVDQVPYYATLSYLDTEPGYRTLSVVIGWRKNYASGTIEATDKTINIATCVMLAPS